MAKKYLPYALLAIIVGTLIVAGYLFLNRSKDGSKPTSAERKTDIESEYPQFKNLYGNEEVLRKALNLYIEKKESGLDLTNGPCLGKVSDDWVVDIAHDPRQTTDDDPSNQCKEYTSGSVKHFIELSPEGKLLRSE